jgi:hypothetical protein
VFSAFRSVPSAAAALATAAILATAVAGCSAMGDGVGASASTSTLSTSSSSSVPADKPGAPVPESTVAASSIDAAEIPAALRLAVVTADTSDESAADIAATLAAVEAFAQLHGATVSVVPTGAGALVDPDAMLQSALADEPNMIIVLGESVLTALDRVSASNIGQQFLVLGAQLPEPTENVTAVIWPGADARGTNAVAPVLAARTAEALEVGVAAVASGTSGIVLTLE